MKIVKGYIDRLESEIDDYEIITTLTIITEKGKVYKKNYNVNDLNSLVKKLGCIDILDLFDAEVCVVLEDDWHPLYLCKDLFSNAFTEEVELQDFKGVYDFNYKEER